MTPKSQPKTSLIWDYFINESKDKSKCKICENDVLQKKSHTYYLWDHIKNNHPEDFTDLLDLDMLKKAEATIIHDYRRCCLVCDFEADKKEFDKHMKSPEHMQKVVDKAKMENLKASEQKTNITPQLKSENVVEPAQITTAVKNEIIPEIYPKRTLPVAEEESDTPKNKSLKLEPVSVPPSSKQTNYEVKEFFACEKCDYKSFVNAELSKHKVAMHEVTPLPKDSIEVTLPQNQFNNEGDDSIDLSMPPKSQPNASLIWKFFVRESKNKSECKICKTIKSSDSKVMRIHIKNIHPDYFTKLLDFEMLKKAEATKYNEYRRCCLVCNFESDKKEFDKHMKSAEHVQNVVSKAKMENPNKNSETKINIPQQIKSENVILPESSSKRCLSVSEEESDRPKNKSCKLEEPVSTMPFSKQTNSEDKTIYGCEKCDYKSSIKAQLRNHKVSFHEVTPMAEAPIKVIPPPYVFDDADDSLDLTCTAINCMQTFWYENDLYAHMANVHDK